MNDPAIACPLCCGRLVEAGDALWCDADRARYPRHPSGLLDLRPPATRAAGDEFAQAYRAARLREGLKPLSAAEARRLPQGRPPGYPELYWQVRRESLAALIGLLQQRELGPSTVADLGAGIPWLSHILAGNGHGVLALDLNADLDFGLGAARHYPTALLEGGQIDGKLGGGSLAQGRFLPVLGSLEQAPLARGAFDAIICNASLHYAADVSTAVAGMARALRPDGLLIVMDSPISRKPQAGTGVGRVLGTNEVEEALRQAGLEPFWNSIRRGSLWRRHQMKNYLLRRRMFDFPMVIGSLGILERGGFE